MKSLKGKKNVELLYNSGKRISSSFLHCIYLMNKGDDSRFVVSVPKKHFSLAVDRNKVKRLVREIIRKNIIDLGFNKRGWFMFVYTSEKIVSFVEIEEDFQSLIKKII